MTLAIQRPTSHATTFEPVEMPKADKTQNLMIEMAAIVSLLLKLLPQLAKRKQLTGDELKQKYKNLTGISADCQRTGGKVDFYTAIATSVLQIGAAGVMGKYGVNQTMSGAVTEAVGRLPQGANIYKSGVDAKRSTAEFEANRTNSELQDLNTTEQNREMRDTLNNVQEQARRVQESASRAG
ncbi:MAG: hypothetical protein KGJ02_07080 [Verrucomicrobiota bacterium]|nr:hypothetical protein [Verrucomicrobiota bacterium]